MKRETASREMPPVVGEPMSGAAPIWSEDDWLPRVREVVGLIDGLALSDVQCTQLAQYMALLQRWNKTYNLTALRHPQAMLTHHLADCLVVVPHLLAHIERLSLDVVRVLDVGSGGGLPGVVLAVACPTVVVSCVDTVGKKAAFVRQVAAVLQLAAIDGYPKLQAVHSRVEAMAGEYDVITSRAFASLLDFTAWTAHLFSPAGVWMAMKGIAPEPDELDALAARAAASVVMNRMETLHVPGLDAQRCLIWMSLQPK